uniref:Uncharacterized protein n=1 Tax=Cacopsylla melanoneura TaxID=428564 RepID=A0A8D8TAC4_9HEMI
MARQRRQTMVSQCPNQRNNQGSRTSNCNIIQISHLCCSRNRKIQIKVGLKTYLIVTYLMYNVNLQCKASKLALRCSFHCSTICLYLYPFQRENNTLKYNFPYLCSFTPVFIHWLTSSFTRYSF